MEKLNKNEDGFGTVEIILALVVVALIGVMGWFVYKNHIETTDNSTTSLTTATTTPTSQSTTDTATTVDPYSGWKTYCDTSTNGCFRYPSDWEDLSRGTDVTALGGNKSETLTLEYNEPSDANGGLGSFLTKSIDSVTISGNLYDIVGGYYTVNNVPGYYLVDSSLAQQLGLKVGQISNIRNNDLYLTFASKKATFVVHYDTAASGGTSSIATSTANEWFTSADGKTALKTVQAFYKK